MSLSQRAAAILAFALSMPAIAQKPTPQADPQQASTATQTVAALDYFKPVTPADIRMVKLVDALGKLPITMQLAFNAPPAGPERDAFIAAHAQPNSDKAETNVLFDRAQDLLARVIKVVRQGKVADADANALLSDLSNAGDIEDRLKTVSVKGLSLPNDQLEKRVVVALIRSSINRIAQLNEALADANDNDSVSKRFLDTCDTTKQSMLSLYNINSHDVAVEQMGHLDMTIGLNLRTGLLNRKRAIELALSGTDHSDASLKSGFDNTNALVAVMWANQQSILKDLWRQQHHTTARPVGPPVQAELQPDGPILKLSRPWLEAAIGLSKTS